MFLVRRHCAVICLFSCNPCYAAVTAVWGSEDQMNESPNSSVEQGLYLALIKGEVTVIMQHKEAAGAEVAVEFDEDLIGGGGHALLYGAATELTNLRRSLVGSIPNEKGE